MSDALTEPVAPQTLNDDRLHVLLVDDEPRVLRGLRRMLRDGSRDIRVAASGDEAMAILDVEPIDVVVTDYQMPGSNGATLLQQIRKSRPQTVRIMLTGEISEKAATRTTATAHQFLNKPCEPEVLVKALERSRTLRALLANAGMRRLIGRVGSLPTSPAVWTQLQRLLDDPDSSARDVAAVMSRDVAMTTKVLQLVNSSFMGLSRTITDVSEAIAYLGVDTVRNLVVSAEVFRSFPVNDRIEGFSVDDLLRHGLSTATLIRAMVTDQKLRDAGATAGMLQDVGQLVAASADREHFEQLTAAATQQGRPLHEVEHEAHGFTHAEIGAYLLTLWGLPDEVIGGVLRHHEVRSSGDAPTGAWTAVDLVQIARLALHAATPQLGDPVDVPDDPDTDLVARVGEPEAERWRGAALRVEETSMEQTA